jgi:hypothetical protein
MVMRDLGTGRRFWFVQNCAPIEMMHIGASVWRIKFVVNWSTPQFQAHVGLPDSRVACARRVLWGFGGYLLVAKGKK